jgi:hypothetical protein
MSKSLNLTILLILLILMSCKDVTMNPKDYPYVITYNPTEINETGITFEGEVFKTTQNSEVQYGFVWSTKDDLYL